MTNQSNACFDGSAEGDRKVVPVSPGVGVGGGGGGGGGGEDV